MIAAFVIGVARVGRHGAPTVPRGMLFRTTGLLSRFLSLDGLGTETLPITPVHQTSTAPVSHDWGRFLQRLLLVDAAINQHVTDAA